MKRRMKTPIAEVRPEVRAYVTAHPDKRASEISEAVDVSVYAARLIREEMEREGDAPPRGHGSPCIGVWVLPPTVIEATIRRETQAELSGLRARVRELEAQLKELRAVVHPEAPQRAPSVFRRVPVPWHPLAGRIV